MTFDHHHFETLPSTNDWALAQLKSEPLRRPLLVTTDFQTHGRGQRENRWHARAEGSVAMSLALSRSFRNDPVFFNKAIALAVREVLWDGVVDAGARITKSSSLKTPQSAPKLMLKWPNDLMVQGADGARKLGGILIENQWRGSEWSSTVVGLGINVHSTPPTMTGTGAPPVSLKEAWNWQPDIVSLSQQLARAMIQADGMDNVHARYDEALLGRGEQRLYQVQGRTWTGNLQGVDNLGLAHFRWKPQPNLPTPPSALASTEVRWSW